MSLPVLEHPTFELRLPSTNKTYIFRPYTVKEQKILLMLQDSTDKEEITRCAKDLIGSCCVGKINPEKLSYFDVEYILLRLRAKSVGEVSTLNYRCNNIVNEKTCNNRVSIDINLEEISVNFANAKSGLIPVQGNINMKLNYPGIKSSGLFEEYKQTRNIEKLLAAIQIDLESITDDQKIYTDFTSEEFREFFESMNMETIENILEFYLNVPSLQKTVTFSCGKCGYSEEIVLKGIRDFFA
jgi:T4 bacteriophage base plate protein